MQEGLAAVAQVPELGRGWGLLGSSVVVPSVPGVCGRYATLAVPELVEPPQ